MAHKSDSITFSVILSFQLTMPISKAERQKRWGDRQKETNLNHSWKKRGNENENHMFLLKVLGIGNTKKENRSKYKSKKHYLKRKLTR